MRQALSHHEWEGLVSFCGKSGFLLRRRWRDETLGLLAYFGHLQHAPRRKRGKVDDFMPPGWKPASKGKQSPQQIAAAVRGMLKKKGNANV